MHCPVDSVVNHALDVDPDQQWEVGVHYEILTRRLYFSAHSDITFTMNAIREHPRLFYFSSVIPGEKCKLMRCFGAHNEIIECEFN